MKHLKLTHRGDTIIEVLLAMSLLTMIIFIAWGTTNRATQINTNARKRVVMVNALKEQAEIIKSKYQANQGKLSAVVGSAIAVSSSDLDPNPCKDAKMDNESPNIGGAYHFKTDGDNVQDPSPNYLSVNGDDTARVWFHYVSDTAYVDFYVRGCWLSIGGTQQEENSQFIVRLNR